MPELLEPTTIEISDEPTAADTLYDKRILNYTERSEPPIDFQTAALAINNLYPNGMPVGSLFKYLKTLDSKPAISVTICGTANSIYSVLKEEAYVTETSLIDTQTTVRNRIQKLLPYQQHFITSQPRSIARKNLELFESLNQ